jgi:UDP-N-acetylmuramoylalanine--D-glutamate ligase
MINKWQGKQVLVIGAARQGLAASRFLASHEANVLLTDNREAKELPNIHQELQGLRISTFFGGHPLELLQGVNYVCVSGGVPLDIPIVQQAKKSGIPITNDAQIFMETVKARIIGVTGSAGKTTTTILIGEIAKAAALPGQIIWVGGNIGKPLVEFSDQINPNDWVIMELSSFQLELMTISPHIAVLLNISPNHLDRHKTMQAYTNAKNNIILHQNEDQVAVINRDDPITRESGKLAKGNIISFGFSTINDSENGTYVENGQIVSNYFGKKLSICPVSALHLPGRHNLSNALAAAAASVIAGFTSEAIHSGISNVKVIPHRLEMIREWRGVKWYNDSIATAPERVMAALEAIQSPVVLLVGGRDKDLPWEGLAAVLHDRKPKVVLFGEAGQLIYEALSKFEGNQIPYPIKQADDLAEAVAIASSLAESGESVLLSPGCTSFDAFKDFEERGEVFKSLVKEMQ